MRLDVLKTMHELGKSYYTIADMVKVTGLRPASLQVFLTRWTRAGRLERIGSGLYRLSDVPLNMEQLGNECYFPSYLSFESALARYGIVSQIPYSLTFATSRRSRRLRLKAGEIEYRQLRKELFFGYDLQNGIYVASPEKALLDQLYMKALGRATLDLPALNLRPIHRSILEELAGRFPERVRRLVSELPPATPSRGDSERRQVRSRSPRPTSPRPAGQ